HHREPARSIGRSGLGGARDHLRELAGRLAMRAVRAQRAACDPGQRGAVAQVDLRGEPRIRETRAGVESPQQRRLGVEPDARDRSGQQISQTASAPPRRRAGRSRSQRPADQPNGLRHHGFFLPSSALAASASPPSVLGGASCGGSSGPVSVVLEGGGSGRSGPVSVVFGGGGSGRSGPVSVVAGCGGSGRSGPVSVVAGRGASGSLGAGLGLGLSPASAVPASSSAFWYAS